MFIKRLFCKLAGHDYVYTQPKVLGKDTWGVRAFCRRCQNDFRRLEIRYDTENTKMPLYNFLELYQQQSKKAK